MKKIWLNASFNVVDLFTYCCESVSRKRVLWVTPTRIATDNFCGHVICCGRVHASGAYMYAGHGQCHQDYFDGVVQNYRWCGKTLL